MIHEDVLARLACLPPTRERDAFLDFISSAGEPALRRESGPEHVTASCFVFSPDLTRILLCFHRKGQFWVQFGGHVEPRDASVAAAALREAREESGIEGLTLQSDTIVDVDRHELHGGFSCSAHWDIGFVAVANPEATVTVSDESEDVRWFPVDALPARTASNLGTRLERARAANEQPAR